MGTMFDMSHAVFNKRERVTPAPIGESYEKYKARREAFPDC